MKNCEGQKTDEWSPGGGCGERLFAVKGREGTFWGDGNILHVNLSVDLCLSKFIGPDTKRGWILLYVNYISTKLTLNSTCKTEALLFCIDPRFFLISPKSTIPIPQSAVGGSLHLSLLASGRLWSPVNPAPFSILEMFSFPSFPYCHGLVCVPTTFLA